MDGAQPWASAADKLSRVSLSSVNAADAAQGTHEHGMEKHTPRTGGGAQPVHDWQRTELVSVVEDMLRTLETNTSPPLAEGTVRSALQTLDDTLRSVIGLDPSSGAARHAAVSGGMAVLAQVCVAPSAVRPTTTLRNAPLVLYHALAGVSIRCTASRLPQEAVQVRGRDHQPIPPLTPLSLTP
jgi:hypothetical protein